MSLYRVIDDESIPPFYKNPICSSQKVILIFCLDIITRHFHPDISFQVFAQKFIDLLELSVYRCIAKDGMFFTQYSHKRSLYVTIESNETWSKFISIIVYCLPVLCARCNLILECINTISPFGDKMRKSIDKDFESTFLKKIFCMGQIDKSNHTIYINNYLLNKCAEELLNEFKKDKLKIKVLKKKILDKIPFLIDKIKQFL